MVLLIFLIQSKAKEDKKKDHSKAEGTSSVRYGIGRKYTIKRKKTMVLF